MSKSKIQLVLEDDVRLKGEKIAKENGMNSYQDLIRYWTVQASKGNLEVKNRFVEIEELTDEEFAVLEKLEKEFKEAEKKGKVITTHSAEEHFKYLGI